MKEYYLNEQNVILSRDVSLNITNMPDDGFIIQDNITGFNDELDGFKIGLDDTSGNAILNQKEPKAIIFSTNNTEKMRLDSTGNLSLGKNNPTEKFDVSGNIKSNEINLNNSILKLNGTNIADRYLKTNGSGVLGWSTDCSNIWNTNGNKIYYNDDFVGIGVNNPSCPLHIYSTSYKEPMLWCQSGGDCSVRLQGDGGESYLEICNDDTIADTGRGWVVGLNDSTDFEIGYGTLGTGNNAISIYSKSTNNYVGIGTNTPTEKLEVSGNTKLNGSLLVSNPADDQSLPLQVYNPDLGDGEFIWIPFGKESANASSGLLGYKHATNSASRELRLGFAGTGYTLTLLNNHNVGISNVSPQYDLDVTGDINASGNVRSSGTALSSDKRIKIYIKDEDVDYIYNKFKNIKIKNYGYNKHYLKYSGKQNNKVSGLIAQELEDIFPDIVKTNDWTLRYKTEDAVYDNSGNEITPEKYYEKNYTDFKTIDMNKLVIKMSATIISAQQKIDLLQASNEILNTDNKKNEQRILILENVLDSLIDQLLRKNLIEQE